MKKIVDEKNKKVFSMQKDNYTVNFTLLDMGEYVGYQNREWYDNVYPYWETMFIEVVAQNPDKNLSSEFLIDSYGKFQRLIISDCHGNKRVIRPITPHYGIIEEDYEFYYGKGIHKQQNQFMQEIYVEETPGELFKSKEYYFDKNTNKFIDKNGNEAPKSILTNLDIGNLFIDAAKNITNQFKSKENADELHDIDFLK